MQGAIVGDVVGSHYEHFPTKSTDFDFFAEHCCVTDDTVLSVAVADWLLHGGELYRYFHDYVDRYPKAGYGGTFLDWAGRNRPYGRFSRFSRLALLSCVGGRLLQLSKQRWPVGTGPTGDRLLQLSMQRWPVGTGPTGGRLLQLSMQRWPVGTGPTAGGFRDS